jgi:hypothetical protein
VSLAIWCLHRAGAAQDTATRVAGFKAVFGVGNGIWLAVVLGRPATHVRFCRSEGPVGPRNAITCRYVSGREPRREGRTIYLNSNINQSLIEPGASPTTFAEGLLIDPCRIENDLDREQYNPIVRYFDYRDQKRRQRS